MWRRTVRTGQAQQRRNPSARRHRTDDCTANVKIKRNSVTRTELPGIEAQTDGAAMILYGLKTCDTCRKALKTLPEAEFRDVRAEALPRDVAEAALARFGDSLINRQSATWRGLSEQERMRAPLALIAAHPALMKRPLIEAGGTLYLGWGRDVQAALSGEG